VIRIRVREQQVELARTQLSRQRGLLLGDLLRQLGVSGGELVELDEISGTLLDLGPAVDELPILRRFARQSAGVA
jgi:hypothetical protein